MFLRVFLGVAIFNYFVSKLPPVLRWVVELLGFEGNRDRAINTFEVVCDLETPQQPLAKLLMISLKWFFFEEQDEALTMLQDLQHRYPYVLPLGDVVVFCRHLKSCAWCALSISNIYAGAVPSWLGFVVASTERAATLKPRVFALKPVLITARTFLNSSLHWPMN